jgi:ribosome biogenesis SPOUT family RNA methylase Rps3
MYSIIPNPVKQKTIIVIKGILTDSLFALKKTKKFITDKEPILDHQKAIVEFLERTSRRERRRL